MNYKWHINKAVQLIKLCIKILLKLHRYLIVHEIEKIKSFYKKIVYMRSFIVMSTVAWLSTDGLDVRGNALQIIKRVLLLIILQIWSEN